mgnify:CR=1 FL=1
MKSVHDVIIRPVLTEKAYDGFADKKYVFEVAINATKPEITQAVEAGFEEDAAQAEKQAIAARTRRHKAHVRIAQLERIRRVAPKLQQLALLDVDIASAEAHRLLADDARDQFRTATQEIAAADSAARELAESIDDQVQRSDALTVDDALLTHARTIDALSSDIGSVEKEAEDIPRRRSSASSCADKSSMRSRIWATR